MARIRRFLVALGMVLAMPLVVLGAVLLAVLLAAAFYVSFVLKLIAMLARNLWRLFGHVIARPHPSRSTSSPVTMPAPRSANPQSGTPSV
jgi:hypothetical protein